VARTPRFEGQPPIDAYGDGGFRLERQRFEGSIIVTPRGLFPWGVTLIEEASAASLAPIIDAIGEFDFLIVGTGAGTGLLPREARKWLESQAIFPDVMGTSAACRTYNLMLSENRRVAAAIIAVD
jgi:uncharacterized protein